MTRSRRFARHSRNSGVLVCVVALAHAAVGAQSSPNPATSAQLPTQSSPNSGYRLIPLPPQAPLTQGQLTLIALETRFSEDVAQHGGKAFASWFEDDAVALSNGQPPVRGRAGIAANATWNPEDYTLTWVAEGAEMAPANDMGYTWGQYQGRSKGKNGQIEVKSGRYITIWKKQPDGQWKVALDASADGPPATGLIPPPPISLQPAPKH